LFQLVCNAGNSEDFYYFSERGLTMVALALAVSVLFGVSANLETGVTVNDGGTGIDGIVSSYPNMPQAMGLDYDSSNNWLWQASQNGGLVYTVDAATGVYTQRFDIDVIMGVDTNLASNGCYLDEATNYLYLADYNGDGGVLYNDIIYCLDVADPDNPVLVDFWDLTTLDGLLGITYKAPYFYCNFHTATEIRAITLSPGGSSTVEDFWSGVDYGGIWYDATWNVFYTHDALGLVCHVLNGDDPSDILDSFTPGCEMDCAMSDEANPAILWTSDRDPTAFNYRIDDEYIPAALENSTWGNLKTIF